MQCAAASFPQCSLAFLKQTFRTAKPIQFAKYICTSALQEEHSSMSLFSAWSTWCLDLRLISSVMINVVFSCMCCGSSGAHTSTPEEVVCKVSPGRFFVTSFCLTFHELYPSLSSGPASAAMSGWPALIAEEIILSTTGKQQVCLCHKCAYICSSFKKKRRKSYEYWGERGIYWIVHVWQWWEAGRWSALYMYRVLDRANSPHLKGLLWWVRSWEIYTRCSLCLPAYPLASRGYIKM